VQSAHKTTVSQGLLASNMLRILLILTQIHVSLYVRGAFPSGSHLSRNRKSYDDAPAVPVSTDVERLELGLDPDRWRVVQHVDRVGCRTASLAHVHRRRVSVAMTTDVIPQHQQPIGTGSVTRTIIIIFAVLAYFRDGKPRFLKKILGL